LRFLLLTLVLLVVSFSANAEPDPGDPCSVEDQIMETGGPETSGVRNLLVCDGANWLGITTSLSNGYLGIGTESPAAPLHVDGAAIIGESTLTCDAAIEGAMRYNDTADYIEYCDGSTWRLMMSSSAQVDVTPNAFSFTDVTDQSLSTLIVSNSVTVTGFDGTLAATVSGGGSPEVSVNGGGWAASVGIQSGDTIRVRLTSSNSVSTMLTASVTIGGTSDNWNVTTRAGNTRIFSTSGTYTGSLGGLAGADLACQSAAGAAGYSGSWQAILSDSLVDARDRLVISYPVVKAAGGATVAAANLWGGSLSTSVGSTAASVWSGSLSDGSKYGTYHCKDWTSVGIDSLGGIRGTENSTTGLWLQNGGFIACTTNAMLYCIEQPSTGCSVNSFSFTNQTGVTLSTLTSSNTITPSGCASDSTVFVDGDGSPEIRIDGGSWTTRGTLQPGDTLQVRLTSNSGYGQQYRARIFIGGTVSTWSVTTVAPALKIFKTHGTYTGSSIGGLAGADAQCVAAADTAGYSTAGSPAYKAVMSDDSTSAASRLTLSYPIANGYDGSLVAPTNLWAGSVTTLIRSPSGIPTNSAWTGSTSAGAISTGNTCAGWTGGTNGTYGAGNTTSPSWLSFGQAVCTSSSHGLICIEQ
jgi:hypothetical protein